MIQFSDLKVTAPDGSIIGIIDEGKLVALETTPRLLELAGEARLTITVDRPVRMYSSGMALRLAFAVATHADADVLIVDEALAVGDGYFQKKSIDRITAFQKQGGTLLFCSHALYYVALLCDHAQATGVGEAYTDNMGFAVPILPSGRSRSASNGTWPRAARRW